VIDVRRPLPGPVVHQVRVTAGALAPGDTVSAAVGPGWRLGGRRAHSGTQVEHASRIGVLALTSESSVGAGMRRLKAADRALAGQLNRPPRVCGGTPHAGHGNSRPRSPDHWRAPHGSNPARSARLEGHMTPDNVALETSRSESGDIPGPGAADGRGTGGDPGTANRWAAIRPLLLRLHFYAGVLIGPFLLVAAATGLLYTTSPQLEQIVYRHELHVSAPSGGHVIPLAEQVAAGRAAVPGGTLQSVSPATGAHGTTRVVFAARDVPADYSRTAFVDPYTGHVQGVLTTYGQWLPIRAWLDSLHRTLHLGTFGRDYSELAASWLWVEVLGGAALWLGARRRRDRLRRTLVPRLRGPGRGRVRSWHAVVGLWVSLGLLGLSATGLTWSDHAGANIDRFRSELKGGSPSISTALPAGGGTTSKGTVGKRAMGKSVTGKGAAGPAGTSGAGIDAVVRSARNAGLTGLLVVTPPAAPGTAWVVKENTRHWPERQDSVAVDPGTGKVTAKLRFADYPLPAKLTRWGIDAHMGLLFGLANQIVLALLAISLITMTVLGYRMWWLRRPTRAGGFALGRAPARGAWRRLPGWFLAPAVLVVAVLGYYLPLFGLPLLVFVATDVVVGAVVRRRAAALEVAR
jgi:uncharacterized iron-regulated membrane protein